MTRISVSSRRMELSQPIPDISQRFVIAVAAESVKLYVAIIDGILNLVDKFFEMPRHHAAVRALEIYKKSGDQGEKLSVFFEICRSLNLGKIRGTLKLNRHMNHL